MDDVEKVAWKEALDHAFKQADTYGWDKSQNYRDYAIENDGKLYPNKIIYRYAIEFLKNKYPELYDIEVKVNTGVGKNMNNYLSSKGATVIIINDENMIYWHIQMNQPWGRNGGKIDSIKMLQEIRPIIGTGDWDDIQCRYFTGEDNNGLKIGDIVLVREGNTILALCEVLSDCFTDSDLESRYNQNYFRFVKILDFYKGSEKFPQPQSTLQRLYNKNTASWKLINNYYNSIKNNKMYNEIIELLKYKKQIILQGPPGTGKTREAKLIAEKLIGGVGKLEEIPESIDSNIIKEYCIEGTEILSARDGIKYKIGKNTALGIEVIATSGKPYVPKFTEIIESYQKKVWENEGNLKGGNDSYSAALAKYIYQIFKSNNNSNQEEQLKLIQFHPSYTYEDFVRGIVSKPNEDGDGIIYEAESKILGRFAKQALDNFLKANTEEKVSDIYSYFENFKSLILEKIDEIGKFDLSDNVYIFYADDKRYKYKGDNWNAHPNGLNMNFEQILKIIDLNLLSRQEINKCESLNSLTRQHATYYQNFVELFKEFIKKNPIISSTTRLKNYVLIIDEINRANLSSVLGELIYALEYRGEAVESMYAVGNDNKLILPPNLYIIGTMNTADRSVGHIDYAIRRRFAFVDILPKDLSGEKNIVFDKVLFDEVAQLFETNLSPEFKKKDVQLGHSYFIDKSKEKDGVSMSMRLEYEIKPILLEYVKDGILVDSNIDGKDISIENSIINLKASI